MTDERPLTPDEPDEEAMKRFNKELKEITGDTWVNKVAKWFGAGTGAVLVSLAIFMVGCIIWWAGKRIILFCWHLAVS